jgi:thermitase
VIVATRNVAATAAAISEIGTIADRSPDGRQLLVRLRDGVRVIDALVRLTQERDVVYVTPNYEVISTAAPNDSNWSQQWGLTKTQTDLAWEIWQPAATTNIAIIDTGVDTTVPDLTNKIRRDSSGAVVGYDVFSHQEGITDDAGSHGTMCAGVAAAQTNNNNLAIAGVAGWNGDPSISDTTSTKIMPVRAQHGDGHASVWSDARGISWAAAHGAGVMNMSWQVHAAPDYIFGIPVSFPWSADLSPLDDAIATASAADVAMIASAGNHGSSDSEAPGNRHDVLAVAASDQNDTLYSYSNYGSWVEAAAPGSNVTVLSGGTIQFEGTSSAAPIVAGEAALIRSQNPNLNDVYVRWIIRSSHDPINGTRQIASDAGRVNVRRALEGAGKPTVNLTITPESTNDGAQTPIGTITLAAPATSLQVVSISTLDDDYIQVPPTALILPNHSSATFDIKVKDIPKWPKTTIIVRTGDGGRAAKSLWVYSLLHGLEQYLVDQQTVRQGKEMAMHIALDHLPRTDEPVDLISTDPAVLQVPLQVFVGANQLTRNLYFRAGRVTGPTVVTVRAAIGQSVREVVVRVIP